MPNIKFSGWSEYFEGFHPHTLYYSFNGVGKTTFAGRTGLKTVLVDCGDAGVMTLRKTREDLPQFNGKIVKVTSIAHYLDIMDKVNRMASQIDVLVIDSLTGLQSMAIKEVKGKRGEMNQRKWGQVSSKVIESVSETRVFPKDVIYLAQERRKTKETDEGDVTIIAPSLTPSVREAISSCVDWVGRLYIESGKRKLSFILSDTLEAKDRSDLFPKVIVNPSYLPIRQRIVESIHG